MHIRFKKVREKVSYLMLMKPSNEILVGEGLWVQPLLAAFHRVRSNMLTDDGPVALATSAPVAVAPVGKAASGSSPICCTDGSICPHLFFLIPATRSLVLCLRSLTNSNICRYLLRLCVHGFGCCMASAKLRGWCTDTFLTCEKLSH